MKSNPMFAASVLLVLVLSAARQHQAKCASSEAQYIPKPAKSALHQNVLAMHQKDKLVELTGEVVSQLKMTKDFDMMVLVTVNKDSHCSFCKIIKSTFKTVALNYHMMPDEDKDFFLGVFYLDKYRPPIKALKFETIPHCLIFYKDGSIENCDTLISINSTPRALALKINQMFGIDILLQTLYSSTSIIFLAIILVIGVAFALFYFIVTGRFSIFEYKYPIGVLAALVTSFVSSGGFSIQDIFPSERDSHFFIGAQGHYLSDVLLLMTCEIMFMYSVLMVGGFVHCKNKKIPTAMLVTSVYIFQKIVKIKLPHFKFAF